MESKAAELIQQSYEALNRDDLDTWLELCHPDAELHELAEMPGTTVYRGHDELRKWAESTRDLVADWHWELEELVQAQSPFVARTRLTAHGREGGVAVEQIVFHVFEMKQGKATAIRGFLDREKALKAAGTQV